MTGMAHDGATATALRLHAAPRCIAIPARCQGQKPAAVMCGSAVHGCAPRSLRVCAAMRLWSIRNGFFLIAQAIVISSCSCRHRTKIRRRAGSILTNVDNWHLLQQSRLPILAWMQDYQCLRELSTAVISTMPHRFTSSQCFNNQRRGCSITHPQPQVSSSQPRTATITNTQGAQHCTLDSRCGRKLPSSPRHPSPKAHNPTPSATDAHAWG